MQEIKCGSSVDGRRAETITEREIKAAAEALERRLSTGLSDHIRYIFNSYWSTELEGVAALPRLSAQKWQARLRSGEVLTRGAEMWLMVNVKARNGRGIKEATLLIGDLLPYLESALSPARVSLEGADYSRRSARFFVCVSTLSINNFVKRYGACTGRESYTKLPALRSRNGSRENT